MVKRIAAFLVLLTMVFAFQGNVWAASVNAEDAMAKQQTEVIALAENPQLAALNEDIQLLGATGFGGMKIEPWFWVLSIVPGLGQFLMGDVVRGILFFFAPTIIGVAWAILTPILSTNAATAGVWSVLGILLPVLTAGVYIWNLVDAYFMNQSKVGMSSIDPIQRAEALEEQMAKVSEFLQRNQISASQTGLGVNTQLSTF